LILQLCDALLRTSDALCHVVAVKLQSACFVAFPDHPDRALIIDAFVAQIGNTMQKETCNAALAELWHLVTRDAVSVQPFQEQVHSLIDYLHAFADQQVKIISDVLAAIAVRQVSMHDAICALFDSSAIVFIHRVSTVVRVSMIRLVCHRVRC
jgi:hypothetical protein